MKLTLGMGLRTYQSLAGLSAAGMLETGYLSYSKLTNSNGHLPFCDSGAATIGATATATATATSSCGDVLNGPYSLVPGIDIPLVFVAFLSYGIVAYLSSYLASLPKEDAASKSSIQSTLLALSVGMGSFSAYLMFILTSVLHTQCLYCYTRYNYSAHIAALFYCWLWSCCCCCSSNAAALVPATTTAAATTAAVTTAAATTAAATTAAAAAATTAASTTAASTTATATTAAALPPLISLLFYLCFFLCFFLCSDLPLLFFSAAFSALPLLSSLLLSLNR
jgi:uncharacterized membrane protein